MPETSGGQFNNLENQDDLSSHGEQPRSTYRRNNRGSSSHSNHRGRRDFYRGGDRRPNHHHGQNSSSNYRNRPRHGEETERQEPQNGSSNYRNRPRLVEESEHQNGSSNYRNRPRDVEESERQVPNRSYRSSRFYKEEIASEGRNDRNDAQESQASSLTHQIESNTYECMVCYDTLNAFCATYACVQCFNIFHLSCIRQWASSKLAETAVEDQAPVGWTCPACQIYSPSMPYRYYCFCKDVINPAFKPFILPHSCGEKCSRMRETCSHKCPELCHPGRCPPCPLSAIATCYCKSETRRVKCSQVNNTFTCGSVCGKLLNCKLHTCELVCHSGDCEPCSRSNPRSCYCGKKEESIMCGEEKESVSSSNVGYWSCRESCSTPLQCGNHVCEDLCHSGPCKRCLMDTELITHCPCGKTKLDKMGVTRTSCFDPVPVCKKVCRKELERCGSMGDKHFCQVLCHEGECPPCTGKSINTCLCESTSESMKCSDIPDGGFRCERVCYKKKNCGRHRCNNKCCKHDDHICMIVCSKSLSCKLHKCGELCHRGHCPPCFESNFYEVFCTCGKTKLEPPVPCGTPPPKCNEPCNRQHSCPHQVPHVCHYEEDCPPCSELVNKMCMGGHTVKFNVPCHFQDISCGNTCDKPMSCSMHHCEKWCHRGDCLSPDKVCEQPCTTPKPLCSHPCKVKCHPNKPCPNTVCFEKLAIKCDCGRRSVDMLCFKGAKVERGSTIDLTKFVNKLCSVGLSPTHLDVTEYLNTGKVPCVDRCIIEERNQRMAEALGLKDAPIDNLVTTNYSEFLRGMFRTNKAFILEVEETLSDLIIRYKHRNELADRFNKVNFMYHDFKPMNNDKRRVVHELAEAYKMTSQSFDEEPKRNVQVRVAYNSQEPSIKLSQVGNRKVISGLNSKPVASQPVSLPNLQTLEMARIQKDDIVFDSWEDMTE